MFNASKSIFIQSLYRKPVTRTPVWLMRQAGRYLPEYRKTRAIAGDFLSLCKNPDLACEVTLQPLRRFALDAAITFSDILTIPDALGLELSFIEGEGPKFAKPLRTEDAINALAGIEVVDDLEYVMQATRLIRQEMPKELPLIGFSGSPWTLACYMVEGGASKREFKEALNLLYKSPKLMHSLLENLANIIVLYLERQVQAGANSLMIFDTWGGILTTANYKNFSLHYIRLIVSKLKKSCPDIPVIVFTRGGSHRVSLVAEIQCDAISVDWTCDLSDARDKVGNRKALQGNLDPAILRTLPSCIRDEVKNVLESYGFGSGLIFNLGHGITPDIPVEHVQVMVDAVHEFSPYYHERSYE